MAEEKTAKTKKTITLHQRIAAAQKKIGATVSTDKVGGRGNTYPSLRKALESVVDVLREEGVTLTQSTRYYAESDRSTVRTILTDSASGEQEISELPIDVTGGGQAVGSIVTYFRRFTLLSALSLAPGDQEEDDAEFRELQHQEMQAARKALSDDMKAAGMKWSKVAKACGVDDKHIPGTMEEIERLSAHVKKGAF